MVSVWRLKIGYGKSLFDDRDNVRPAAWRQSDSALCRCEGHRASGPVAHQHPPDPEHHVRSQWGQTISASEIGLPTGGAKITSTALTNATINKNIASTFPEYCTLTGVIYPYASGGININFKVAIPTQWNQKSWQFGGGGTDGSVPGLTAPSTSAMLPSNVYRPLALQYATYGGDSGHSSGNTWIDNPNFPILSESFQNFYFDALKKTHDAAVAVMNMMYGKAPAVNYFAGQSQGGREALTVLWRYPHDYDGIMAQDFLAYFANLNFNPQLQGSLQVSDYRGDLGTIDEINSA